VEADGEQDSSPKAPPPVAPITAVIAEQVKHLRKERRLSGPGLAAELNKRGIKWNRTTVAKFETGLRSSITVQEFLALALALRVAPVILLADPRRTESVPLAGGGEPVEPDAWSALLWAAGFAELDPRRGAVYQPDALVHAGVLLADLCRALPSSIPGAGDGGFESTARVDYIRDTLQSIRESLLQITSLGAPMPPLPSQVRLAARRYGVDLPGVEV
jgi:transcriptional regulator with XRE-family HTH domain